jgi:hypothetical protein
MMDQMMSGGMWGMGVAGFILLALVVLAIAALINFLFFR